MVSKKYQRPLTIPEIQRADERQMDIIAGMFAGGIIALIVILIVVLI